MKARAERNRFGRREPGPGRGVPTGDRAGWRAAAGLGRILLWLGMLPAAVAQTPPGPIITEFKAVNNGPVADDDGLFSDWIEIYNPTTEEVNLEGWSLTDVQLNPRLWTFPPTNLPAGGFMVVHASGRNRRVPGQTLHTNFRLTGGGEYLGLVRPDGRTVASEFAPFPPQTGQFSYGFYMVGGQVLPRRPGYLPDSPGRANPGVGQPPPLALTELMYHPQPPPAGNGLVADDFEFIELRNIGTNVLNLAGLTFARGVQFTFNPILLEPGARVVLVENAIAFQARYGPGIPVAGEYDGSLADGGEQLTLLSPDGAVVFDFTYSDKWARLSDGVGYSLVPVDEAAPASGLGKSPAWRASGQPGGSPGRVDPPSTVPPVRINEVLTRTVLPYEDAIELFNPTGSDVDISGWFLTDDFDSPRKYRLPRGAVVPAGGYLALDEHAFNAANDDPTIPGFGLADFGEEVYLLSADVDGSLSGWAHGFRFDTAGANVPFIRHVISTGEEHFIAGETISFLASNGAPRVGPVVISEIHYHPAATPGLDTFADKFIQLHNVTDEAVPLFDPRAPTNTWQLLDRDRGLVLFRFPTGVVMTANSYALLVGFRPDDPTNAMRLEDFSRRLGVVPGTLIFGPWTGGLDDAGVALELQRPDGAEPLFVPYVTVDRVDYSDLAPWPVTAGGTGASIQRIHHAGYGNEPTNWWAATPAPGRTGDAPPRFTRQPADQVVAFGATATFQAPAAGTPPIEYQWRFQGTNLPGANQSTLILPVVLPGHEGDYTCLASNVAHTTISRVARLRIHDDTPPALTIAGARERRVTSAAWIHEGTVSDDAIAAGVFARLNGGPDRRADGLSAWMLPITLQPGFNTLVTHAVDWRGNRSGDVTNVLLLEPRSSRLGLWVVGEGAVAGAAHGQVLEAGRSYALTATPRPGHRFRHWLDWNSGGIQTNRTLQFAGGPDRTFTASFEPGPFVKVAGAYNGLFHNPTNPAHLDAGLVSFLVTPGGGVSGTLIARGRRQAFGGMLDARLRLDVSLQLSPTNTLRLLLAFDPATGRAGGELSENRFLSTLNARRKGFRTSSLLAGTAGRYTATLTATADPVPARQRQGSVLLGSTGLLRFRGRLPDGTAVARDVHAGEDGLAPFYLAPYGGRGSVFGWLSLTNAGTNTLRGELQWQRTGRNPFTNGIDLRAHR